MDNTQRVLQFVANTRWTGMEQAKAGAALRRTGERYLHSDVRRFAEDVAAIPKAKSVSAVHPEASSIARGYRRESEDLSPAELMWLQRLPLEPEKVTHDDAARLAGMAGSIGQIKSPSSFQLLQSIWQPVKELHDLRVAEEQVRLARTSLPRVPSSAKAALIQTLKLEHRDWPESAVRAHAAELLEEATARREREHAQTVERAERTLARLKAEAADRRVTARVTA